MIFAPASKRLPAGVVTDVRLLSAAARRGTAEAFTSNIADSVEDLRHVLNDDGPEIQRQAGIAMLRLDQVPAADLEDLIHAFIASSAFPTPMGNLIHPLERIPTAMPANTITSCGRVVDIAGAELADPPKSGALIGRDLTTVVLRLYRQTRI